MNVFEKLANSDLKCEICGSDTVALYGCGWDRDTIFCSDISCGAEYLFPTSTTKNEEISTGQSS